MGVVGGKTSAGSAAVPAEPALAKDAWAGIRTAPAASSTATPDPMRRRVRGGRAAAWRIGVADARPVRKRDM
ncbi:hypothetical protein GCM10010495_33720 [Kitasatospora herbaricolor]|nr:hypothetical protein GCM10010495_33720 [Kitasatospora herbaricolor]